MQTIALEGFWLLAAFAVVYLVGVFTAQYAKDKLFGVPSDLRAALKVMEAGTLKELAAARSKLIADTVGLLSKGKAVVAAQAAPLVPVAPSVAVAAATSAGPSSAASLLPAAPLVSPAAVASNAAATQ